LIQPIIEEPPDSSFNYKSNSVDDDNDMKSPPKILKPILINKNDTKITNDLDSPANDDMNRMVGYEPHEPGYRDAKDILRHFK